MVVDTALTGWVGGGQHNTSSGTTAVDNPNNFAVASDVFGIAHGKCNLLYILVCRVCPILMHTWVGSASLSQ